MTAVLPEGETWVWIAPQVPDPAEIRAHLPENDPNATLDELREELRRVVRVYDALERIILDAHHCGQLTIRTARLVWTMTENLPADDY